jgi:hypothetical protein
MDVTRLGRSRLRWWRREPIHRVRRHRREVPIRAPTTSSARTTHARKLAANQTKLSDFKARTEIISRSDGGMQTNKEWKEFSKHEQPNFFSPFCCHFPAPERAPKPAREQCSFFGSGRRCESTMEPVKWGEGLMYQAQCHYAEQKDT